MTLIDINLRTQGLAENMHFCSCNRTPKWEGLRRDNHSELQTASVSQQLATVDLRNQIYQIRLGHLVADIATRGTILQTGALPSTWPASCSGYLLISFVPWVDLDRENLRNSEPPILPLQGCPMNNPASRCSGWRGRILVGYAFLRIAREVGAVQVLSFLAIV
jgi:hypothetical protein